MQISKEQLKYLLDWAFKFGKENVGDAYFQEEVKKVLSDMDSKPVNQTLYSIKGLASDHPANKDFNKYMQKRAKNGNL
jgi:ribulose bisphosphate carboxylase small subunit